MRKLLDPLTICPRGHEDCQGRCETLGVPGGCDNQFFDMTDISAFVADREQGEEIKVCECGRVWIARFDCGTCQDEDADDRRVDDYRKGRERL